MNAIRLNFVNQSSAANLPQVVVFQKNEAGSDGLAVAWAEQPAPAKMGDAERSVLKSLAEKLTPDNQRRLAILDEKLHASLLSHASEELMLKIRREVDSQLAAYRRKMKAEQLAVVEKQYLQKRLLDEYRLPRLSLFYFA